MKKLILSAVVAILVVGCIDANKSTKHPESHVASIYFTVSDGANVASYNIYRGNELMEQVLGAKETNKTYTVTDATPVATHPYNIQYSVEPMFLDSVANTSIQMAIHVDAAKVAQSRDASVLYGEVVTLSYIGE